MTLSLAGATRGSASWLWWAALAGLCLVLLMPFLVVDVPPLGDYPNHLARAFVLASLPGDGVLATMYAPRWSIIPNLAIDLAAPPLMQVLPVHVAGRVVIGAAMLLPVLGTVAYNTALGGRWWPLCAGFVAYHSCLLYGFLNFSLAVGLALLLGAAWVRWRETHPAWAILLGLVGTPVLFACHLMGLVFFAALLGGVEICWMRTARLDEVAGRVGAVVLIFATPAALYALSALQHLGGDAEYVTPVQKLLQLFTAFVNYNRTLDVVTGIVAIGLPVGCVLMRKGVVPAPAGFTMIMLAASYLVAPFAWKGTYLLDTRFAIMLGFMLFAGFVPARWPRWLRLSATGALVALLVARISLLTVAWAAHAGNLTELRHALAPIQPGQTVYVADVGLAEAPAYWAADPHWLLLSNGARLDEHLGALALIERRAYWPFEFDIPSQQPIETLPPYAALAGQVGSLPNRRDVLGANLCGFDYLLLIEADATPALPAERFRMLTNAGFAALYAITGCQPQS